MKYKVCALISVIFTLSSCSNGGTAATSTQTSPLLQAHVACDVVNNQIVRVRAYIPNGSQNIVLPENVLYTYYPHSKYKYLTLNNETPVTYYYNNIYDYRQARAGLDPSFIPAIASPKIAATLTPQYLSQFDIGYQPSIGAEVNNSGALYNNQPICFNYTASINSGAIGPNNTPYIVSSNMDYTTQVDNTASTLNEKNSISAFYGEFKGSNSFQYNDKFQGTDSSNSFSFFGYTLVNMDFTIYSLSANGLTLLNTNPLAFQNQCGRNVITQMPMGINILVNLTSSNAAEASTTSWKDTLTAGYGDMISMANTLVSTQSSSLTDVTVQDTFIADGDYLFPLNYPNSSFAGNSANDIITNWQLANDTAQCNNPASSACTIYLTQFSDEVTYVLSEVQNALGYYQISPNILSQLAVYPNGVNMLNSAAGYSGGETYQDIFTIPGIAAQVSNQNNVNDPWAPYSANLANYTNLIYQISSLANRASMYASYLSPALNAPNANVSNSISSLANYYYSDITSLTNLITPCLNNAQNCATLPQLGAVSVIDYYSNPTLYNSIETSGSQFLNDKLINASLLLFDGYYSEQAIVDSPTGEPWYNWNGNNNKDDSNYTGSGIPTVKNSVPMRLVYLSSNDVAGNFARGLYGIASSGVTLGNPYCANPMASYCVYSGNGQGGSDSWELTTSPFNTTPSSLANPTPFYYVLSTVGSIADIEKFFTGQITIPSNTPLTYVPGSSNLLFAMPLKYINGQISIDAPLVFNGGTVEQDLMNSASAYPSTEPNPLPAYLQSPWTNYYSASGNNGGQPTANTQITINPNGQLSPFVIQSQGALDMEGGTPINGVFGPLGTSLQLANVLSTSVPTYFPPPVLPVNASIYGLNAAWIMVIPDGLFNNCGGAYGSYAGCNGTGLYPYGDIFTQGGRGSNTVQVMSTLNSLQFNPVPGGIY